MGDKPFDSYISRQIGRLDYEWNMDIPFVEAVMVIENVMFA